ncbi:MAG: hypothetical protein M3P24_01470 [Gemmatimonadota bacterium]|nr:hypothetical protein [Gemmatimonadota bacterium]
MAVRSSPLEDSRGFIVFGALVMIVVVVVAAVLLGKVVRYQYPPPYIDPDPPQLLYLDADAEVRQGSGVTRRLRRGDSVWVAQLQNGDVAVFADGAGGEVLGFVPGPALSPSRPPDR